MTQSLKYTSRWLTGAAIKPQHAFAALRYRLQSLFTPKKPLPEHILASLSPEDDDFRHLSFTFAVIALSARVACADGNLRREHYVAFRECFPLKGDICARIRQLFTLACQSDTPYEHYVTQIKCAFPGHTALYHSLVKRLLRIAGADGMVSRNEEKLLSRIAHAFGISPSDYARMLGRYDSTAQAQQVLGVARDAKAGMVKKRYRELMRHYHPDRYAADDLSPEVALLLQQKASEINHAYKVLLKQAA